MGRSLVMQDVYEQIEVLAKSDAPVIIHGESGTGKELVARAIHNASPRAEQPFIAVNCGALAETLLDERGEANVDYRELAQQLAGIAPNE